MTILAKAQFGYLMLLLLALLFFGTNFTKLRVFGPLHLYDLFLGVLLISAFGGAWKRLMHYRSAFYFSCASIFYFIFSVIVRNEYVNLDIMIRQFAVCGYFITAYLIANSIDFESNLDRIYKLLIIVAKLSVAIQIVYIGYLFLMSRPIFGEYNYYSPLVVMGLMVFVVHTFFNEEINKTYKFGICVAGIFLLVTSGHSSAVIAIAGFFFTAFFLLLPMLTKIPAICLTGLAMLLVGVFQSYLFEVNSIWRLVFWREAINRVVFDRFLLFGHGFGVEYLDKTTFGVLVDTFNNIHSLNKQGDTYRISFHNSFLNIIFHVGMLPFLFLSVPVFKVFKLKGKLYDDRRTAVVFFSLMTLSIWCFFNVVLELPHSSLYYWLFYFLLLAIFRIKCEDLVVHER